MAALSGPASASGAAVKAAGVASHLEQSFAFVDGGVYRIELVLSQITSGTVRVGFAGNAPVDGIARNANGTFIDALTANAHTALRIIADAAFVGRIERVSLRRLA